MERNNRDLFKMGTLALLLVTIITLLGVFVIPNYIFVNSTQSYISGVVDHKSISSSYLNGEQIKDYTVSVKLFEDDVVNDVKSNLTSAYIVSYNDWLIVEWGDIINLKVSSGFQAKINELYPSIKLPEWHSISGSASPLSLEISTNKKVYSSNEKININITIKNAPIEKGWNDSPIPIQLQLQPSPQIYIFKDGKMIYSSLSDKILNELTLEPEEEIIKNCEFDLNQISDENDISGIFYIRIYLGHLNGSEQKTLTCTTMIEIGTE